MRCPICNKDTPAYFDCIHCQEIIDECLEEFNKEDDEDAIPVDW